MGVATGSKKSLAGHSRVPLAAAVGLGIVVMGVIAVM